MYANHRLIKQLLGKSESQGHRMIPNCSLNLFCWMVISLLLCQSYSACIDIGRDLSHYPCLEFVAQHSLFTMSCSFAWTNNTHCIVLQKNEVFEGNGNRIHLDEISNWEGLFRIADSFDAGAPSSLQDAPVIVGVHTVGGETSSKGGFIVQAFQKHFIVRNCSSSGVIQGLDQTDLSLGGGGICGQACSGDILITHSWSAGEIRGHHSGGIAGKNFGFNAKLENTITISHCYSLGDIVGLESGGIAGSGLGLSATTIVQIRQCYSIGEIRGIGSGGLSGSNTGSFSGHVSITDSYSRGNITGPTRAGGICGRSTSTSYGSTVVNNVYASGRILQPEAGGIIGSIPDSASLVNITASVHSVGRMVGMNEATGITVEENNSGDLKTITDTVYCYDDHRLICWDTQTIWQEVTGDFPILQDMPTPFPSASSTLTSASPTITGTATQTASLTPKASNTLTASPSTLPTATPTQRPKRLLHTQLPVQRPRRRVITRS